MDVDSKAIGTRAELVPRFEVPLPETIRAAGRATLRELIGVTVAHERAAADERRRARSLRQVLTERDLSAGAASGTYRSGERPTAPPPPAEAAVRAALEAFGDGLFLVVVDGTQRTDLDERFPLTDQSTVTYLRLVALAGG